MPPETAPLTPRSAKSARAVLAENIVRLRAERAWSQETLGFETGLNRPGFRGGRLV